MKKAQLFTMVVVLLCGTSIALAVPTMVYDPWKNSDGQVITDPQWLKTYSVLGIGAQQDSTKWYHENPYDLIADDYWVDNHVNDCIIDAKLYIDVCSLTLEEDDYIRVRFWDKDGNAHHIGNIQEGENYLNLNPAWLNGTEVKAILTYDDSWLQGWDGAMITNAYLCVTYGCQNVIPAPGAILLGGIGTGLVGWLRRRKIV